MTTPRNSRATYGRRWRRRRSRRGSEVNERDLSRVVPAKAGTHNHRGQNFETGSCRCVRTIGTAYGFSLSRDDEEELLHASSELVRLRKTFWRQAASVGAVAAPIGEFLDRGGEFAAGGIFPGQAVLGVERRDVG